MESALQGEYILRHFERFLGKSAKRWAKVGAHQLPFQVLLFEECINATCQCLVTYGLSSREFRVAGKNDEIVRCELIICADLSFDARTLAAALIAVGLDSTRSNSLPDLHGVLAGEGGVLSNPLFEHFYLTSPGFFPIEFEICEAVTPHVEIMQLIPISSRERDLISVEGWRHFEEAIVSGNVDLMKFDLREEVGSKMPPVTPAV